MFKLKQQQLVLWHRRTGIGAALFVVLLALTGILLNHSASLGLDKRPLQSTLLLDWYGVEIPGPPQHYGDADNIISQLGDQLFYNGVPLMQQAQTLRGVVSNDLFICLAFERELLLITHAGDVLERIGDLPAPLTSIDTIGIDHDGRVALRQNDTIMIADQELIGWQSDTTASVIDWSDLLTPGAAYDKTISNAYRQTDLSYERLLLDLHSGRLFGISGPWLMDLAALAMILLALSGVWRWFQSNKKQF